MRSVLLVFFAVLSSFYSFATLGPIAGPNNVCGGSNLILTNTTPGGVWTVSSSALASISGSSSSSSSSAILTGASVSSSGTVIVTYTVGAEEVYKNVTVNPTPAAISAPPAFCNDVFMLPLSCPTPGGVWSCGGTASDSVSPLGVLYHVGSCPSACGSDIISYTIPATGCAATRSITVNPIVVAYIPPLVCLSGSPSSASAAPAGGTWSSSSIGVASIDAVSGHIFPVSAGSATFTYTLLGCTISNIGFPTYVTSGISDHHVNNLADTTCSFPDYFISACGTSSLFNVTTYFGDGTNINTSFGGANFAHVPHNYEFPGTYHVKQLLYNGVALIDSAVFDYEYLYCNTLPIKIFVDKNHNCVKDGADHFSYMPITVRIDSNGVPVDTMTATSGLYYKATGPAGTIYAFRVLSSPAGMYQSCPAGGVIYDTIVATVNTYVTKYFGMECTSSFDYDLAQNTAIQCGRHFSTTKIQITNSYGTIINPVVKLSFSPKYNLQSASPTPTSVVGNTITWNFDTVCSLQPLPKLIDVSMTVPGAWLLPGDTIHSSIESMPMTGDVNTGNNNSDRVDTVKSSFDPNEISVTPAGIVTAGTQLQYTIVFENDGNDTAHNIYVMDTISDYLDISSLRMVMASATMNIAVVHKDGYNIVKFDFPNINLLDSSHHNQCSGMLMYNINTRSGLADGTVIPNRVGIYFDDNEPIMTNTATSVIGSAPTLYVNNVNTGKAVTVYPNPTKETLTIEMDNGAYTSFTVTNSIGQVMLQQPLKNTQTKVDVKILPAGLYYITMKGNTETVVKKFVKE